MELEFICPFCDHQQTIARHNGFTCDGCGHKWVCDGTPSLVLTPAILVHDDLLCVAKRIVSWMDANGYDDLDQSFGARAAIAKAKENP